ncbi:hypothetical protein HMPREF9630_01043 [Peptoanaerobacter stomatis]|uniref:THUMP domain-containing protein n=1 Tax=Peptoanaerobacter stomatis TaxID=796937 RepID=V9HU46_9FIRM|nr:class I SAM-dependent RNA methyltransferase [Peptoanaerobacter stomatis]EHL14594.1 hypothetical protein HMPREF9630_01043 [Peptoanaerobacter stomatis]
MYNLVAPCLFGLEKTVAYELKKIGAEDIKITDGRVHFKGDDIMIVKSNICLRTAQRVLIQLGQFKASTFEELFQGIKSINYSKYIKKDYKFTIAKAKSVKSKLTSIPTIQSIAKKAMAERLKLLFDTDILPETSNIEIPFNILIQNDIANLYIDTSGSSLHKRGYRELTVEAPIRETIAAFMVEATPWNISRPFYDITCGSGTIPIEAALIGLNIQAGINREFLGERLPFIDKKIWNTMRSHYISQEKDEDFVIKAYDKDKNAIEIAKNNAKIAGVENHINFEVKDVKDLNIQESNGFIISNPPYGVRIGEEKEIQQLYSYMKKLFKTLDNFSYYIITSDEEIGDKIGIPFQKNRKIYNGRIKTHFYQYLVPKKKI